MTRKHDHRKNQEHRHERPDSLRVTRLLSKTILALAIVTQTGCGRSGDAVTEPRPDAARGNETIDDEVAKGGRLYDKFWSELSIDPPSDDHPLWARRPDLESNERSGADTWRCKECHGWDYKAVAGAYGSGSHRTGFPGILGTARSTDEIADLLAKEVATSPSAHGYGSIEGITDDDLRALAAFVTRGTLDTTQVIDGAGRFTGSATAGKELFMGDFGVIDGCVECHGEDGLSIPGDDDGFTDFVGKIAGENAAEFQHKVRFGQPGTDMPSYAASGLTADELADLGAFAQTLPHERQ